MRTDHSDSRSRKSSRRARGAACAVGLGLVGLASAMLAPPIPLVPATLEDFHLSGTQVGDIAPGAAVTTSDDCFACHGTVDPENDPYSTWSGSLMAVAGRDPLFLAQMTNANQDVANVGYFCMRCHVPMSFVTGHAYDVDGSTLDATDLDGVNCNVCHAMVDPVYKPGESPIEDQFVLDGLADVPDHYGNAMFVLDPFGFRRGPYQDASPPHMALYSPFHRTSNQCATCHDVGNVAVTKVEGGVYRYNALDQSVPDEDLATQFPLERTFSEWKLSAFAQGDGVDMGGRFGGEGATFVSTCQDCHMPRTTAQGAILGPIRDDLARHDFAGASAWVLEIVAEHYRDDPAVNVPALERGRDKAIDMLRRAATVELLQVGGALRVRVVNETGHKLPTGHIEGRRVWVNTRVYDAADSLVREYGHYDAGEAHLDADSTTVFEMHVGLSEKAAAATGHPAGVTTRMALADTIEKDNRIPPRGFMNEAYEEAGAPVVGAVYQDDQHWADVWHWLPDGAARVEVTLNYQTVTRHYIEALRDGNVTDHWGETLYNLWLETNKGAPIEMATAATTLSGFLRGDLNQDGAVSASDLVELFAHWGGGAGPADLDGSTTVDGGDLAVLLANWGGQ